MQLLEKQKDVIDFTLKIKKISASEVRKIKINNLFHFNFRYQTRFL